MRTSEFEGTTSEHGADRERTQQRADAEGGVQQPVAGRISGDTEILLGDDRQLTDEGQREGGEHEDRHQTPGHDAIGSGDAKSHRELPPSLAARGVVGDRCRDRHGQQRSDHEHVGDSVAEEDPVGADRMQQ